MMPSTDYVRDRYCHWSGFSFASGDGMPPPRRRRLLGLAERAYIPRSTEIPFLTLMYRASIELALS